jgi:hypothetical protein
MFAAPSWIGESLIWFAFIGGLAGAITGVGVIWHKAIKPVVHGVQYVENQMKNNGGKTARDAIDRIEAQNKTIISDVQALASRVDQLEKGTK